VVKLLKDKISGDTRRKAKAPEIKYKKTTRKTPDDQQSGH
jgi:hypothetical protein